MTDPMIQMQMDDHIRAALREDMPFGDVSTAAVMPESRPGRVQLIAKADGVIAGLAVFSRVFELLDPATRVTADVADGERVSAGQHVATVEGDPFIAFASYGKGRSGVFTTDCAPHWAPPEFCNWEYYNQLFKGIVEYLTK